MLANLKPEGETDLAGCLNQIAAMLKHRSLIMLFSDLLVEPEPMLNALYRLRHGGHDIIVFHVLDEAEVRFPFTGMCELEDPETGQKLKVDANGFRSDYVKQVEEFRGNIEAACQSNKIDYVALDTSMQFDKALMEYLVQRRARF
jgi:uncharacterized protein (DUF58 family)